MKLAAIYNVFDGEEILQSSIDSIRKNVDAVIVVFQQQSNFGINHIIDLYQFLNHLKGIDYLIEYKPDLSNPAYVNEITKRVIGYQKAKSLDYTHFLYLDCDELYDEKQFVEAKLFIEKNDIDSSICMYRNFYKFENLEIQDESFYVPFIHKIKNNQIFGNVNYPVLVDFTRKCGPNNTVKIFNLEEICMKHLSWIRKDIKTKLLNSSSRHVFDNIIEDIVSYFETFSIQDKLVKLNNGLILPEKLCKGKNISFERVLKTREVLNGS